MLCSEQGNRSGVVGCGFYNNNCGGLDLTLAWQIVYVAIAIMVVIILPFAIYFYEADDEVRVVRASFVILIPQRRRELVQCRPPPVCIACGRAGCDRA